MNDTNYQIDSAKGLLTYLKTIESAVKIQKRGAEIILDSLSEHNVQLYADKDAALYTKDAGGEAELTTVDDVVDMVCEYNFEDIYDLEDSIKKESDFVSRCKAQKRLDELKRDKQILDKIFYHTKYGRKVGVVADRICAGLCEKLCLVPVYNIPMYEDKVVSEGTAYETAVKTEEIKLAEQRGGDERSEDFPDEEEISEDHIVASESVSTSNEPTRDEREESKGAR